MDNSIQIQNAYGELLLAFRTQKCFSIQNENDVTEHFTMIEMLQSLLIKQASMFNPSPLFKDHLMASLSARTNYNNNELTQIELLLLKHLLKKEYVFVKVNAEGYLTEDQSSCLLFDFNVVLKPLMPFIEDHIAPRVLVPLDGKERRVFDAISETKYATVKVIRKEEVLSRLELEESRNPLADQKVNVPNFGDVHSSYSFGKLAHQRIITKINLRD